MKRFSSLFVVASLLTFAVVGCAAPSEENDPSESQGDALTRSPASTTITSGTETTRCGDGSVCTETSTGGCDGFRDKCKAQSGCGTTSAGNAGITVVSCITIPPRPQS